MDEPVEEEARPDKFIMGFAIERGCEEIIGLLVKAGVIHSTPADNDSGRPLPSPTSCFSRGS